MGNQNEKTAQNGQVSLNINHPRFKNAKLVNEAGQKQMQVVMGVDEKQYQRWNTSLNQSKLNSPFLLLPKKKDFSRKGFCGDSGTLKLNFDNYSYLLTEEIYNKNGKKSKFEQCELWYLLFGLISAQQQLKRKTGGKVGDIRPHNVFLNADGQIKVSNMYSWPRQLNNFNKTFDHQKTYLAPEDIVRLQMGINEQNTNYSSEVFSIGLTVLSAAMLEDFLRLYDIKSYKFNSIEATNILDQWKSNSVYSEIFTAVVSNLCEFQPEKRLTDEELWGWICKYQVAIKNKEDFVIEEAPEKIDLEIQAIRQQFPDEGQIVYQQQYIDPQHQQYIDPQHHQYIDPQHHQYIEAQHQMYQQQSHRPHPFTDKSVVQSYIPPNQHYLPNPTFIPQMPVYQHQEVGQNYVTRHQGSPAKNTADNMYIQQSQQNHKQLIVGDQVVGKIVGRPLQEHELPAQVRQAMRQQGGQLPARFLATQHAPQHATQYAETIQPGYSGKSLSGQTQLPPQFVGRTVNETYLSNRGGSQSFGPQGVPVHESAKQGLYGNIYESSSGKGRIEETMYIQRPESNQYQQRYEI